MLMQSEMKMPINRPVKTRHSQLQAVKKNELIAKNRGMGWVRENLINTDGTVYSDITPQHAGLLFSNVAKQKDYWLCGSCNVRVKLRASDLTRDISLSQFVCLCLCEPNAISVNLLNTHVAVNIPKETIKLSQGNLRQETKKKKNLDSSNVKNSDDCKETMTRIVPEGSIMLTVIPSKDRHYMWPMYDG